MGKKILSHALKQYSATVKSYLKNSKQPPFSAPTAPQEPLSPLPVLSLPPLWLSGVGVTKLSTTAKCQASVVLC